MRGFRNWSLGVLYLGACIGLAYMAEPETIKDMGNVFTSIGIGVTGVAAARAANKWAERNGQGENHVG